MKKITLAQLASYFIDVRGYGEDDVEGCSFADLWDSLTDEGKEEAIAFNN